MSSKTTKQLGDEGEDLAVSYLETKGYTILERNYFFQRAEVDIVAHDDHFIVFVEVKMRSNTHFGKPEEFVTEEKIKNIYKAADAWLHERKMDGDPVRFDVVSIVKKEDETPHIKHFENAFYQ